MRGRAAAGVGAAALAALAASSTGGGCGTRGDGLPPPPARGGASYLLSQTGLYDDVTAGALAPGVRAFAPAHALWSDGADKSRWIRLPPGEAIDTRDPDHWRFPVGTRAWKEFRRGGRRLETRMIARVGPGPGDYWMGAFVWDAAGRDAVFREEGEAGVHGTDHDVPPARQCASCHGGEPGRILGFSAVQLAGWPGSAATAAATPPLAGDPAARAALGYLHANCGHCHGATGLAFRDVDLVLRLRADARTAEETDAYRTTAGVPMQRRTTAERAHLRIAPGAPDASGLLARLRSRDPTTRMPPLGTTHPDPTGTATVAAWITTLPSPLSGPLGQPLRPTDFWPTRVLPVPPSWVARVTTEKP